MEKKKSQIVWVAVIVAMPLFYFLSIGPIYWLDNQFPGIIPLETLKIVYTPVEWLYENSGWAKKFYHWYMPFWE